MLVDELDWSWFSEIDADTVAHDWGRIKQFANEYGIVCCLKGNDNSAEGFEG